MAAGKVASEKGQSEAVKQFAQLMVEAHGKTNKELKGIVQAEKLDVELPSRLDRRRQKLIEALNKAKPEDFDALYDEQQVKAHDLAAGLYDGYAEQGGNAALKQFAANTLPAIRQQRREAEKLPQYGSGCTAWFRGRHPSGRRPLRCETERWKFAFGAVSV
ncbi:MAG TPA: DUF4142 domain-containing protein [Methyloceanibacter sp.]|nr:DUF4142 domain-containing protein [Methyloceanibacter sp.]